LHGHGGGGRSLDFGSETRRGHGVRVCCRRIRRMNGRIVRFRRHHLAQLKAASALFAQGRASLQCAGRREVGGDEGGDGLQALGNVENARPCARNHVITRSHFRLEIVHFID
jgi:hypothetical protein